MNDLLLKTTNLHLLHSSQQHIWPLCVCFYLPAWSSLYMYSGFSVPEHCEVFPKQMHNGVVSCLPDIYFLPVNHTGWILHMNHIRKLLATNVTLNHFTPNQCFRKHKLQMQRYITTMMQSSLTGFPLSLSNTMKERPAEMRSDFLQITPLSKQSTFSAVTDIIASNEL